MPGGLWRPLLLFRLVLAALVNAPRSQTAEGITKSLDGKIQPLSEKMTRGNKLLKVRAFQTFFGGGSDRELFLVLEKVVKTCLAK